MGNLTNIAKYLNQSAMLREQKRKEEEAQRYGLGFLRGQNVRSPNMQQLEKMSLPPIRQPEGDPRVMAEGDTAKPMSPEEYRIKYGDTEAGQRALRAQAETPDIADPQAVYEHLRSIGMEKEAASYAQRVQSSSASGGKGSVWAMQGEVGGEDLSAANVALLDQYAEGGLLTPQEAEAMKVINQRRPYDVSDWLKGVMQQRGKAFAGIPGKVAEQDALLPGKVRAAGATAAAGEAAKLPYVEQREEIKRKSKQVGESAKATVNFEKVKNLMKNIWERKKEQLGATGSGLLVGGAKVAAGKLKLPGGEATAKYEGQKTETAMALNSILTGQNRLIEGIFHRIAATLPDELDPKNYAIPKIEQSLRNSYGLVKAMRMNGLLDEEYLQQHEQQLESGDVGVSDEYEAQVARLAPAPLDESEEAEIREIVNYVLGKDSPYYGKKKAAPKPSTSKPSTAQKPANMTDAEWKELQELEKKYGK